MNVYINDELISITLQGEKSLGDLSIGIGQWLEQQGLYLTRLEADGNELSMRQREIWEETDLDSVREVRVYAGHPLLVEHDQLSIVADYLSLLLAAVGQSIADKSPVPEIGEILDEFPHIITSLKNFLGDDDEGSPLAKLRAHGQDLRENPQNMASLEAAQKDLELILGILQARLREYQNPWTEAIAALNGLRGLEDALAQVSMQMQTGGGETALLSIHRLIEVLQKLIRCLQILQVHPGFRSASLDELRGPGERLNELLAELSEGIEHKDVVLIGDILEYELPPAFAEIREHLERVAP